MRRKLGEEEHSSRGEATFKGWEMEEGDPCGWKAEERREGEGLGEVGKGQGKQDGARGSQ